MTVGCMFLLGLPGQTERKEVWRVLSDSFVIPGVLMGGVGAMSWANREGAFDMLSYGIKLFFGVTFRSYGRKLPKDYGSYCEQQREKRQTWLKEAFVVGDVILLVGILLMIPYYL